MSVAGFVAVVVLVLFVGAAAERLLTPAGDGAQQRAELTSAFWVRTAIAPDIVIALVLFAIVAALGWWDRVVIDDRPVASWVGVVPLVMALQIVVGVNYRSVADTDAGFTAFLLVSALAGALWEEVLFRGIGVAAFRSNGYSEGWVALWTSVLFGLGHTQYVTGDVLGLVYVTVAGYLFYLVRRWSGGLALPVVLHGLGNFALKWPHLVTKAPYAGLEWFLASEYLLAVVVLFGQLGVARGLERPWADRYRRQAPRTPTRRVVLTELRRR